ncbi:MAG: DUF5602 domain-containing protein [Rhodothermia bacterium]|nr:MAG: DUF5602 domain-containing protein [Rhodothermia bacterium]
MSGCENNPPPAEEEPVLVEGECLSVYGGELCTWGVTVGENVVEFGANIPLSAIQNAPLDDEMVFPPVTLARIPLPSKVSTGTGIDHLGINWEAHGHPPGPYLTPHFDFHFNTVSIEAIEAIDCADVSKPDVLPAGYVLPDIEAPGLGNLVGLCVPDMGMHAMSEVEMSAEDLFGASMIVGYYAQDVIFVEPMIARDKLLEEESFELDVPAVENPGENVVWPSSFEAVYDNESQSYRFTFSMSPSE